MTFFQVVSNLPKWAWYPLMSWIQMNFFVETTWAWAVGIISSFFANIIFLWLIYNNLKSKIAKSYRYRIWKSPTLFHSNSDNILCEKWEHFETLLLSAFFWNAWVTSVINGMDETQKIEREKVPIYREYYIQSSDGSSPKKYQSL